MFTKEAGFGGALLAMHQGYHVGRRAWERTERIAMLPGGVPGGEGKPAFIRFEPADPMSYREWFISNADALAQDWYVHE